MATERESQLLLAAYQAGITSQKELAIFMAQVSHESGDLKHLDEGFRYTKGINQITRDAGVASALRQGPEVLEAARVEALLGRSEKLAELMYGGRMGNDQPGDGYKYHGRGYLQLTGKNQYERAERDLGLDIVDKPELAAEPEYAAKIAVWYWKTSVPVEARENLTRAGGAVNRGDANKLPNHPELRQAKHEKWGRALTPEVMKNLSRGESLPITARERFAADPTIKIIQSSLTTLGYADAQGRALIPDGNYGPNTRYAIESFQRQSGLEVNGLANQDTLSAIQQRASVLNPLRDREQPSFDQALPGLPPELQARVLQRASNGPEQTIPGQALPAPQPAHHVGPMSSRGTPPPAAESVRLPPMPPVQQLQPGAQGAAVFVLQEHLRMLNAHDAEGRQIKPDRDYGPRTVQAVENFQMWAGLNPSGSADRTTLDALTAHAQYAQRQQAQGIPKSDHLADNLNPALSNPTRQVATQEIVDEDRELDVQEALDQLHQLQIEIDQGRQLERQVRREENETREQPRGEDRRSGALLLFCDVQHPQHALYADVKERLEVRGHALPEDRLHQITAELHMAGFKAGWEGSLDVYNQAAYALNERNLWGGAAKVPLSEPVPPMHASVEAAHHHDQLQASMQAEFAQRQQMERYAPQQGPVLG